jgi:hypothetical protein
LAVAYIKNAGSDNFLVPEFAWRTAGTGPDLFFSRSSYKLSAVEFVALVAALVAGVAAYRFIAKIYRRKLKKIIVPAVNKFRIRHRQARFLPGEEARRFREGDNTYALYRIIGNALPPRHTPDQALQSLRFQLDHEKQLDRCEKFWVVNRISDPSARDAIVGLLADHGQEYFEIPFDFDQYRQIDGSLEAKRIEELLRQRTEWDKAERQRAELAKLRLKRLYVMNNNGARNAALEHGRARAKWVLPWDGNCFLTPTAWDKIRSGIEAKAHLPYHVVNMARLGDNASALDEQLVPDAREEPQLVFHRLSSDRFDEALPYGRRPKVELLTRLGVTGPWDTWRDDPWDIAPSLTSPHRHLFAISPGWVFRLTSGDAQQESGEGAAIRRLGYREAAIAEAIERLDRTMEESGGAIYVPSD